MEHRREVGPGRQLPRHADEQGTAPILRLLTVRHVTTYWYTEPVEFGEHRMMFRPRESHDLRFVGTRLDIQPRPAEMRWLHDVFDLVLVDRITRDAPTPSPAIAQPLLRS
jgi:transglutaminase superfamily protein